MDTREPKEPGNPLASGAGRSPWAQWEYTPEEWHLFDQRDWQGTVRLFKRSMQDLVRFSLIVAVFGVSLLLIFMLTGRLPAVSPLLFGVEALGLAAGMMLLLPIFALTDVFQLLSAWKRHLARRQEAHTVIIGNVTSSGKQAIWIGKQAIPLQTSFLRLSQAILYEDRQTDTNAHSYLALGRRLGPLNLASIGTICVLVPRGYEKEARQLAERFNKETISRKRSIPR